MANIDPCVKVSLYLLQNTDWDKDDITPRIMTYHSRQILLLRHEQEKYLDSVLKRKTLYGEPVDIKDRFSENILIKQQQIMSFSLLLQRL